MIPKSQFTRAVTRFEKAVIRLKQRPRVSTRFEYRDAKRSLIELGHMLITGEGPQAMVRLTAVEIEKLIQHSKYGAPKTGIGAQR